jgi:hypothetical protein
MVASLTARRVVERTTNCFNGQAFVGLNSTVLIKAAAMYKRVCAFGEGIGHPKNVFILEVNETPPDWRT